MRIELQVRLEVRVAEEGANLNEICAAVETEMRKVDREMSRKVIEQIQEEIVEKVTQGKGKREWTEHRGAGRRAKRCPGGKYTRAGWRQQERRMRTELGEVRFPVQRVKCGRCERILEPILRVLEVEAKSRKSEGILEALVEVTAHESYRGGVARVAKLKGVPIPKSTSHQWIAGETWEELELGEKGAGIQALLFDGTGIHMQPRAKGEIRLAIGMDPEGRIYPLGAWANETWEEIGRQVKEKIEELGAEPKVRVMDGERAIEKATEGLAPAQQRCAPHVERELGWVLWKEEMPKEKRDEYRRRLKGVMYVSVPQEEYKRVKEQDKQKLEEQVNKGERVMEEMENEFASRGYRGAAGYLRRARERVFTYVRLWLEIGYLAPRTISLLERMMREVGRRMKKIGASWSDQGAQAIARIVLKKTYEPSEWREFWRKKLGLRGRCTMRMVEMTCRRAA